MLILAPLGVTAQPRAFPEPRRFVHIRVQFAREAFRGLNPRVSDAPCYVYVPCSDVPSVFVCALSSTTGELSAIEIRERSCDTAAAVVREFELSESISRFESIHINLYRKYVRECHED